MLTKSVQLIRGDSGFGFSVIGGSDTYLPPMVFTLAPNNPAELSGQVVKGDRILEVNGVSAVDISSKQVIQLINDSGNTMKLSLQDDPDLKRRLNAFVQAKARSASPATREPLPPVSRAACTPAKPVVSPRSAAASGRALYQPTFSKSANGTPDVSPQRQTELRQPEPSRRQAETRQRQTPESRSSQPDSQGGRTEADSLVNYNLPRTKSNSAEKYKVPDVSNVYNDLDTPTDKSGLRQTSLSFLSEESAPPNRTYSGVREQQDSRNETQIFDVNPTFVPPSPPDKMSNTPNVPVIYAQVNKNRPKSKSEDERPFSGITQVYSPPPQYETQAPTLPPDLPLEAPPHVPPRETAESCARRLFYQEGCVPEDVSFTLASTVPFDMEVSDYYMHFFNFDNFKLDDAVRVFVERAPLIGENTSRERILFHLSKHLHATNSALRQQLQGPDQIHTLVCALMMLNTDLHGGMVDKKMTYNQFESSLRTAETNIDKGVLKDLYNGIKQKPIIVNAKQLNQPPKPLPTLEQYENVVHKQGPLTKKNFVLSSGKRPGVFKRGWKRFDAELRGSKLTFTRSGKRVEVICHHCLATRALVHRSRTCIILLVCADDRQFLIQSIDDTDMQEWMHAINKVAAMFSALPMAAPVSNSNRFQPHSLPLSRTKCSLEEQLQNHMTQVDSLTTEYDTLIRQQSNSTPPSLEWHYKRRYLEREKEKFEEYAHLLNTLLFPDSEESLMSPQSFGRATANRMSYKRAVQKNVKPVNV